MLILAIRGLKAKILLTLAPLSACKTTIAPVRSFAATHSPFKIDFFISYSGQLQVVPNFGLRVLRPPPRSASARHYQRCRPDAIGESQRRHRGHQQPQSLPDSAAGRSVGL